MGENEKARARHARLKHWRQVVLSIGLVGLALRVVGLGGVITLLMFLSLLAVIPIGIMERVARKRAERFEGVSES